MQFSRMRRCRYLFILTRTLMLSKTILCCDNSISCSTTYRYLHTALSYIFDAALDGASCPLNVTLTTLTRSCTYTPSKWSVGSLMVAVLQFFEPFLILSRFSFRESYSGDARVNNEFFLFIATEMSFVVYSLIFSAAMVCLISSFLLVFSQCLYSME
jgi:hypothetical protein